MVDIREEEKEERKRERDFPLNRERKEDWNDPVSDEEMRTIELSHSLD